MIRKSVAVQAYCRSQYLNSSKSSRKVSFTMHFTPDAHSPSLLGASVWCLGAFGGCLALAGHGGLHVAWQIRQHLHRAPAREHRHPGAHCQGLAVYAGAGGGRGLHSRGFAGPGGGHTCTSGCGVCRERSLPWRRGGSLGRGLGGGLGGSRLGLGRHGGASKAWVLGGRGLGGVVQEGQEAPPGGGAGGKGGGKGRSRQGTGGACLEPAGG